MRWWASWLVVLLAVVAACGGSRVKTGAAGGADGDNSDFAERTKVSFEAFGKERDPVLETATLVSSAKNLPLGFAHDDRDKPPTVSKDFPTAADPHAVLGRITFERPPLLTEAEERKLKNMSNFVSGPESLKLTQPRWRLIMDKIQRFAADRGANVVYWASEKSVWALYVSPSPTPPGPEVKALLSGLVPPSYSELARATFALDVDKPGSLDVALQRGKCYGIAVVMTPEARRERSRGWAVIFDASRFQESSKLRPIRSVVLALATKVDGVSSRGHFEELFCPLVSENVSFVISRDRGADQRPAGHGDAVVVLLQRPGKPNEVHQVSCNACAPAHMGCGRNMTFNACKPSVECLQALKMTPGQCKD